MLFSSLRVYEDVIYEYYEKRIKFFMVDPIAKVHICGWCICENKLHDKTLVMTTPCMEGSLRNFLMSYSKMVIPLPEINFSKET